MIRIIQRKKIFLGIAGLLVALSIVSLAAWGLKLGIDFTGGSLMEVTYLSARPDNPTIRRAIEPLQLGTVQVQPTRENGVILRFGSIDETTHQNVLNQLKELGELREERFDSIGPAIGQELQRKAVLAIVVVVSLIILYIAWAFRKVSKPVSSWKYGLVAIIALIHDVLIPSGVVAALGRFGGFQVDAFFITALLTILGFSVHDTIVVFDRIRENLQTAKSESFDEVTNRSVNEVMARSINTSLVLLLVLLAVLFFGGATTKNLVFVLAIGIFSGTYSSIFVASPLLTLSTKIRSGSTLRFPHS